MNAHNFYEQVTKKKMYITKFPEVIVFAIFESFISAKLANSDGHCQHKIEEVNKRGRCIVC